MVWDSWRAYKDHGILLVQGAFLDQPAQWWEDMQTCNALYATAHDREGKKKRQKGNNTE